MVRVTTRVRVRVEVRVCVSVDLDLGLRLASDLTVRDRLTGVGLEIGLTSVLGFVINARAKCS